MSAFRSLHGPVVLVLGPHLAAISGVSAHLRSLLQSGLQDDYVLDHFLVGSEGRGESRLRRCLRLVRSPFALAATIMRLRPDIMHVNTSLNPGAFWRDLAYMLVARLHGVRVVCQVHGGKLPQDFIGRSRLAQALLRTLLSLPDALVVLAQTELLAYRSFLPRKRLALIANGVDHAALAAVRPATPPGTPLRLVYLGRLAREKGVLEMLQGLATARKAGANATLAVAGSGTEEAAMRTLAAALGLDACVRFLGPAFDADKRAALREADVFVLPSYSEGLPIALLEAMAAGTAVIATPVGAIPDVVTPVTHGFLVPPRDAPAVAAAILGMDADRDMLRRMQRACAARIATDHSLEQLARSFAGLYGQLLDGGPEGRVAPAPASPCAE